MDKSVKKCYKEEEEIVMALQEMARASNDGMVRQILEMMAKTLHEEASRLYQAENGRLFKET